MVYQGSKTRLAKYIVPYLQAAIDEKGIDTFIDCCCGGCNIIDKVKAKQKIAIDIDPTLIAFYNYAVIEGNPLPETVTREDWDRCKDDSENQPLWEVGFVSHFASFNAGGFSRGFAKPTEKRDYAAERIRSFMRQIPNLQGIKFECKSVFDLQVKNAVIYIDPPYKDTHHYSKLDKIFDYELFWNKVRELSKDNVVFVSEVTVPDDFTIVWSKERTHAINGRSVTTLEKLVTLNS
jgi:DNA adenine methylase